MTVVRRSGIISIRLGALVIVLGALVFGAAIQAANGGLYYRSEYAKRRKRQ